jgi:hypothetical protein
VTNRRLGVLLVLGGSALTLAIQVAAPVVVPLYDGVVIAEPYRYLHPSGDQLGDPTSSSETKTVAEGVSPVVVAFTAEIPPQAQLNAQRDAFVLTADATSIVATIEPIDPPAQPTTGPILGNAYRFSVTDQAGTELRIRACDGCVSIALRAPDGGPPATLMRFVDGAWQPVLTRHGGTVALFQTNPVATGIYAVVATGEAGGGSGGVLPGLFNDPLLLLAAGGIALIFIAFVALLYLRARPSRVTAAEFPRAGSAKPTGRLPSKRRGSKRPPSGRSGS